MGVEKRHITNGIAAAPLTLWYGWLLARRIPDIANSFGYGVTHGEALYLLRIWAYVASSGFLLLFSSFMALRIGAIKKTRDTLSWGAAAVGAYGSSAFLFLPISLQPPWVVLLSAFLVSSGTTFATYSLAHLGRSISIFPAARALVLRGPYKFIRHPIYLGELVAVVGTMLLYEQPWSIVIFGLIVIAQGTRAHREEALLEQSLPRYKEYRRLSYCLIPGIY
jgi:protein-S-isoprenylcysteine O-methyltransferase Ste14